MRKLSIVIPAYNEERTLGRLLEKIQKVPTDLIGFDKEVIVVDDGSKDTTLKIAQSFNGVIAVHQDNQGKGRAVQRGIKEASGQYVLVQDADLEYEPMDYLEMLKMIPPTDPISVYGSRTLWQLKHKGGVGLPGKHPTQGVGPWLAGVVLSIWFWLLYGRWIWDTLTGYKIYPLETLQKMNIKTHGFETDHEIGAKLVKAGIPILEVPVQYFPRSREEGKKIKFSDGIMAVWTMFRFRLFS